MRKIVLSIVICIVLLMGCSWENTEKEVIIATGENKFWTVYATFTFYNDTQNDSRMIDANAKIFYRKKNPPSKIEFVAKDGIAGASSGTMEFFAPQEKFSVSISGGSIPEDLSRETIKDKINHGASINVSWSEGEKQYESLIPLHVKE